MIKSTFYIVLMGLLIVSCNCDQKGCPGRHNHDEHAHDEHVHNDHDQEEHHHHHGEANELMNENDFQELVEHFESEERDEYQKPNEVISFLGDMNGKKVIDIGSGTGYFSFKLVEAGAQVIAADVDDRFQQYIQEKKEKLGVNNTNLELRKVPYDSPNLEVEEVDIALIVNTYHHIEKRVNYFKDVLNGLRKNGRLVIIDFKKMESPMGPPLKMKMSSGKVISELTEAGYENFKVNNDLLEYQYVIEAF